MEEMSGSCSVGKLAPWHDFRHSHKDNIDPELSKDNITIINNLMGEDGQLMTLEQYTDKRFQPMIDQYNAKQKQPCRRIKQPYTEYFHGQKGNEGKPLAYEYVVQFGDSEGLGGEFYSPSTSPERKEEIRQKYATMYNQFIGELQKRYPHMEVVYAVVHMDEPAGTPHLHMTLQPVGDAYKKGLSQQVSMSKALSLDGLVSSKEAGWSLTQFCQSIHNDILRPMIVEHGYQPKEQEHGREHQTVEQFKESKRLEREIAEKLEQSKELDNKIAEQKQALSVASRDLTNTKRERDAVSRQLSNKETELERATSQLSTITGAVEGAEKRLLEVNAKADAIASALPEPLPEPVDGKWGKVSKDDYDAIYKIAEANHNAVYHAKDKQRIAEQSQTAMAIKLSKAEADKDALQDKYDKLKEENDWFHDLLDDLHYLFATTDFHSIPSMVAFARDAGGIVKDAWNTLQEIRAARADQKPNKMLNREIEDPER